MERFKYCLKKGLKLLFAVAMVILFMIPKYSETVLIWLGVITLIYLAGYALVSLLLLATAGVLFYLDKKTDRDNNLESEKLNKNK